MNKKALKPIIITAVVLVLIVGAYFLMTLIPEPVTDDVSPSPTTSKTPESFSLFNEDYYSLRRMELEFGDGSELTIDVDDSKDTRIFNLQPARPGWNYSQDTLRATAFNLISITAVAKVAEGVTDFSDYELDSPQLIARAIFDGEDGKFEREIHIGKITAVQDSYYARMEGDDTVYAVSKYVVQNLMRNEQQYRKMDFFPSYLSEDMMKVEAAGSITYIRVRNPKTGSDIEISLRSDDELSGLSVGSTKYHMLKPVVSECNDAVVEEKLINIAAALTIKSVVEDDPSDLEKYGLDEPLDLWMTNTDGTEIHYMIGDNNGTAAYVMVEGTNSVLIADAFASSLRELKHVDFMFKLAWIHNIDNVKSILYDLKGEKRLFEIRENKKNEEGRIESFAAVLDGRPIAETNARRLFSRTLNMMIMGEMSEPFVKDGKTADYTFTISMTDGTSNELKLYPLNERQYAVSVNNAEASYYINVSDIRNLLDGFSYIDRGEEMPR